MDPNLVAVAPFDAVSSAVAEFREGLVTILSRSLDGAGPIRRISPTVVVRRWAGQSDPTSASALGHSTGAGLVVFGQVVTAGSDSVRLTATIYDVRRERPAGEVEVRDERQRIDRIADTLAVRLLREPSRTRPVGAVRFASLGSTSLPAIKFFLQAEQSYRHGQWDSTVIYAQRAVAVDSNFTLPLHRIPNALWWSNTNVNPILLQEGALAYRGHLREAAQELGAHRPWLFNSRLTAAELLILVGFPPDSVAGWLESLLYLALAHRDTTRALTLFAGLPDSLCRSCHFGRLSQALLLSARRQDGEAAALLDEPLCDAVCTNPTEVAWALERGRVNERLGNRDKAIESYSFVAAVWSHADPELQPYVQEAKAALQRLSSEPRQ